MIKQLIDSKEFRLRQPRTLVLNHKILKAIPDTNIKFNAKYKSQSNKVKKISGNYTEGRETLFMIMEAFVRSYMLRRTSFIELNQKQLIKLAGNDQAKYMAILRDIGLIEIARNKSTDLNLCRAYRLTESAMSKWIPVKYEVTTSKLVKRLEKWYNRSMKEAQSNIICKSILESYKVVNIPSPEEVRKQGMKLKRQGYTKKGNAIDIDAHMNIFDYLITQGFIVPRASDNAGGRVISSINMLPSWIREMIKIENEDIAECDYAALHPNIAVNLYSGQNTSKGISHDEVALYLDIERSKAKIEHLSFFNKKVGQMRRSPLWKFYSEQYPTLMENLINEKNEEGYKSTSLKLFTKEVEMMTLVTAYLQSKGIPSIYVYDAMYVAEKHKGELENVMNMVADAKGIRTGV